MGACVSYNSELPQWVNNRQKRDGLRNLCAKITIKLGAKVLQTKVSYGEHSSVKTYTLFAMKSKESMVQTIRLLSGLSTSDLAAILIHSDLPTAGNRS